MALQKADIAIRAMEKEQRTLGKFIGDRRIYTQRIHKGEF